MPITSAGVLMYQGRGETLRVLLVHPGGPFWRNRDDGAWTIPKGLPDAGETAEAAARREFEEELGAPLAGDLQPLGRVRQRGGKWVEAFAVEGRFDVERVHSNTFAMEWPPRSGRMQSFTEVDRAEWFPLEIARTKILAAQVPLLDRLAALIGES